MTCTQEPLPAGWRLWRGSVPQPLVQLAVDVRDAIRRYPYGAIARTVDYQGTSVAAFKSHHTWTYRNGALVTGLCIPGVSLLVPQAATVGLGAAGDLQTPDPTAAVYEAPEQTDWTLVAVGTLALGATTAAFLLALKLAGKRP